MITDVKLHKPQHFDRRFEKYLKDCDRYIQAYELTEQDYYNAVKELGLLEELDPPKYASYNSFRNAYNTRAMNGND